MAPFLTSFVEQFPVVIQIWVTLELALLLFLTVMPTGGLIGWMIATRQRSRLSHLWIWLGMGCALIVSPQLLVGAVSTLIEGDSMRVWEVWIGLFGFSLVWVSLYASRLFKVTRMLSCEELFQMGVVGGGAHFAVVRPLLFSLLRFSMSVALLVVVLDHGVTAMLQPAPLSIYFMVDSHFPLPQSYFWIGLLMAALLLLKGSLARVRIPIAERDLQPLRGLGGLGLFSMLFTTAFYTPLLLLLRDLLNG